jgi:uncharacterized protein (TIGR02147 family)
MEKTLFGLDSYIEFIKAKIRSFPHAGHGQKGKIAKAIGCHPTYITQVLQGRAHLSPEQGESLSRYFNLSIEEKRFFMLLLLRDRAGTRSLKEFYFEQMRATIADRQILKNRLEFKKTVSKVDQATYYSVWYYAAIHSLLSIPKFQTPSAISEHLGLSSTVVSRTLEFLVKAGLATQENGTFRTSTVHMHLGNDSAMISKHHVNWRMECMKALDQETPDELHYSSIATLAVKDLPKIRAILVHAIEEARTVIRDSPEEELYCYCLDLFQVTRKVDRG